jgi:K+-sensing histidine kinase KdpD
MAQLGIAVEIIDHEFNHLYATINHSMENLYNNEMFKSSIEFNYLTDNIKQLENKYELLSPLYRSTNSPAKDIRNHNIIDYLNKFFKNSIEGYSIKIEATPSFLNQTIYIKEPIIYTVYINIINNAIYWMRNSEKRIIKFDYLAESNEFVIINSGAKIENHRLEKIFQLFYSNRPNGRGIGLYLAKKSLNEYNYDIHATNDNHYNILNGACFVIKSLN